MADQALKYERESPQLAHPPRAPWFVILNSPLLRENLQISSSMLLDSQIRDWVLIPILVIVLIVNYARMYTFRLLAPNPEGTLPVDAAGVKHRALHAASLRLRQNGGFISHSGWAMRKHRLIGVDDKGEPSGLLYDKTVKDVNALASGPAGQMDMVKMMVSDAPDPPLVPPFPPRFHALCTLTFPLLPRPLNPPPTPPPFP